MPWPRPRPSLVNCLRAVGDWRSSMRRSPRNCARWTTIRTSSTTRAFRLGRPARFPSALSDHVYDRSQPDRPGRAEPDAAQCQGACRGRWPRSFLCALRAAPARPSKQSSGPSRPRRRRSVAVAPSQIPLLQGEIAELAAVPQDSCEQADGRSFLPERCFVPGHCRAEQEKVKFSRA